MNSVVSLPIAPAIPTAAPAIDFPIAPVTPLPASDLKFVELAKQFIAAVAERRRLGEIEDQMKSAYRKSDLPEALRIRPSDAELGRTPWESADEFWHRPVDVDKWRNIHGFEYDMEDKADGFVATVRKIKRSRPRQSRG